MTTLRRRIATTFPTTCLAIAATLGACSPAPSARPAPVVAPTEATPAPPAPSAAAPSAAAPSAAAPSAAAPSAPSARVAGSPSASAVVAPPPSPPASVLPLAPGCFASSTREHGALCVTGASSIQGGCKHVLGFLGPAPARFTVLDVPPQCLGPQAPELTGTARETAERRHAEGRYTPLGAPMLTVAAGGAAKSGDVQARLARTKKGHVSVPMAGAWDVFEDRVEVSCGKRMLAVHAARIEGASGGTVTVHDLGDGWLLVTYAVSWGIEGDLGSRLDAAVIEPSTCRIHRPAP